MRERKLRKMDLIELKEFANSQREQGWLGAMNIVDQLKSSDSLTLEQATELRFRMQQRIGEAILYGTLGADEHAFRDACNQSIESVISYCQEFTVVDQPLQYFKAAA